MTAVTMFAGRDPRTGWPSVLVHFPYDRDVVHAIKLLDSNDREWLPDSKLWRIKSPLAADLLLMSLRKGGHVVAVYDPQEIIWRTAPPSAPESPVPDWAEAMFRALPLELHTAAYNALLRVLHPDRAGESGSEPTKALNAARDRVKELSR
ncbi:hypothetical protein [Streptomyces sp. NBC_00525]|uniref:hypothetical protein n=1 Tax=Streptomyces sp. NBC_00525 TaxID=2903660 RepID=UPI002E806F10|nr:hypothetical protein [Streptomyces sp. NBC_00525]WUC97405.1 hypothetical protein OG710_28990 [Streptomyces sp. NBC_00525]